MIYSAEELYSVVDGVAGWMRGGMGEFANRRDRLESAKSSLPRTPAIEQEARTCTTDAACARRTLMSEVLCLDIYYPSTKGTR